MGNRSSRASVVEQGTEREHTMDGETYKIETLRAAAPRMRAALAALVAGAQLLRHLGAWEAYAETDGKVRPLGIRLSHEQVQELIDLVPGIQAQVARPGIPDFFWIPARCRDAARDLLTMSMNTSYLVVQQGQQAASEPAAGLTFVPQDVEDRPRAAERA